MGADCLLHCERRAPAIEARQQIVGIERDAPIAFAARRREVPGGFVELRLDPQRLFVLGDGAVDVALLAVGSAAIVVGVRETGIKPLGRDRNQQWRGRNRPCSCRNRRGC
jgi:hypothetical protein